MFRSLPPHRRRLLSSVAYSALVATVAGLGYLTSQVINERQHGANGVEPSAESVGMPLVDIANFAARHEKSTDGERLAVSLRLRLTAPGSIDCFVFVVARNDHVSPRLWAAWPPEGAGGAVSVGGHFRVSNPSAGYPLTLTPGWTRMSATLNHPVGQPRFEIATVYVVNAAGEVLLSRPFTL